MNWTSDEELSLFQISAEEKMKQKKKKAKYKGAMKFVWKDWRVYSQAGKCLKSRQQKKLKFHEILQVFSRFLQNFKKFFHNFYYKITLNYR